MKSYCIARAMRDAAGRKRMVRVSALSSALLALMIAIPAHAEDSVEIAAGTDAKDPAKELDAVKVVGQRVGENKSGGALGSRSELDTPFSLTTIGSEEIEARQVDTVESLFMTDTSVGSSGAAYSGFPANVQIRGLPADMYDSLKLDGMPAGFIYGINMPLEFMEQVQLLKGSSGFMYGFGAPGGIINYILKPAVQDDLLSFDAGYRSSSIYRAHLDAGGRLFGSDMFSYRFNASREEGTSANDSEIDREAFALALHGDITENLTWHMNVMMQERNLETPTPYYYIYPGTYAETRLPVAPDGSHNISSEDSLVYNKFEYYETGLNWRFADGWSFDLRTSKIHSYLLAFEDFTYLMNAAGDLLTSTWTGLDITDTEYTQAMVQGAFSTGPVSHEVVFGASYQKQFMRLGHMNFTQATTYRLNHNLYDPQEFSWATPTDMFAYDYLTTTQESWFASDTIGFGKRWSALLGVRGTEYERITNTSRAINPDTGRFDMGYTTYRKNNLSPTYALIFKPVTQATVYASYVQSLEPGSIVGSTYENYGDVLDPIETEQYEVGAKWEEGRWSASAAAFRIDRGAGYATSDNYYVQSGVIRYQGAELAASWLATDSLRLGASAFYLDSSYEETADEWLIGKAQSGTRKVSVALDAAYNFSAVPGLSVHAVGKYFGEGVGYNNTTLQTVVEVAPYTLFNVGAGYQTTVGGRDLTFRAEVENLFDKAYWSPAGSYVFLGTPRTFAVSAKIDF